MEPDSGLLLLGVPLLPLAPADCELLLLELLLLELLELLLLDDELELELDEGLGEL